MKGERKWGTQIRRKEFQEVNQQKWLNDSPLIGMQLVISH